MRRKAPPSSAGPAFALLLRESVLFQGREDCPGGRRVGPPTDGQFEIADGFEEAVIPEQKKPRLAAVPDIVLAGEFPYDPADVRRRGGVAKLGDTCCRIWRFTGVALDCSLETAAGSSGLICSSKKAATIPSNRSIILKLSI